MEEPVSAPSTEPEPEPSVVPSEPDAQPDPLPCEPSDASVEPTAAPAGPAAQSEPLPREPSVAPAEAAAQTKSVPPTPPVERPRKKRKLEEVGFENSTYFKIRTIVKNLRPSFVQVFQNPNFRETNLAGDILKDIKTVLELSKQLRADLAALSEPRKASSIPPAKEESNEDFQGDGGMIPQINQAENVTNNSKGVSNSDNNLPSEGTAGAELKDVPKNLEDGFKGSYVVGGSPVGWNYLVFPGSKPMYYGRSKAEKQACQIEN